jgi:hypothetical protein
VMNIRKRLLHSVLHSGEKRKTGSMQTTSITACIAVTRENEETCVTQLVLSEETAQHSATEIARESAGRKGAGRDIRSLTELVAARKGKGIRDSQHDSDN